MPSSHFTTANHQNTHAYGCCAPQAGLCLLGMAWRAAAGGSHSQLQTMILDTPRLMELLAERMEQDKEEKEQGGCFDVLWAMREVAADAGGLAALERCGALQAACRALKRLVVAAAAAQGDGGGGGGGGPVGVRGPLPERTGAGAGAGAGAPAGMEKVAKRGSKRAGVTEGGAVVELAAEGVLLAGVGWGGGGTAAVVVVAAERAAVDAASVLWQLMASGTVHPEVLFCDLEAHLVSVLGSPRAAAVDSERPAALHLAVLGLVSCLARCTAVARRLWTSPLLPAVMKAHGLARWRCADGGTEAWTPVVECVRGVCQTLCRACHTVDRGFVVGPDKRVDKWGLTERLLVEVRCTLQYDEQEDAIMLVAKKEEVAGAGGRLAEYDD
ncbi:hypothetical protein VOLCADRAFT_100935 [Volvox carteri f. nagariensis]|uniref:Uncharacterized protein n=1 Tax=Volvox carteri f. nagariensis TaxID=3068 RepID=D8ULD3_VOLCA|nr:uncharacterized protein VOLCADRAFT_100935 [Volvox carteri f. nagariensis]EFJ39465.1 hypothetical protein VOLCADRAFT_100935 [Volvox carteri f. nagariensis]|eukprot:XP_002959469.1 hypothetical protein VOLCADRAFT_100935 [Volvox carteri f. nagariensis]